VAGDQGAGGGLSEPAIAIIAAVARNGVIGAHNNLIWRLSSDLKRFRALTMGKPVIMGRKTWDSINRLLPGRQIIVVTRNAGFAVDGVLNAPTLDSALSLAREIAPQMGAKEIVIAGGGEIYRQSIHLAQHLYITEVDLEPRGDVRFPAIDSEQWREVRREKIARGERDEADSVFVEYVRRL
jgi:dihydrofolate reductase